MATLVERNPASEAQSPAADDRHLTRSLHAAYARERIEEVVRAIAEDALNPSTVEFVPWHDEGHFEDELHEAVREIADTANGLLAARLATLLESAPPRLAVRLASAKGFPDLS